MESSTKTQLPLGMKFSPTDEQLVANYLMNRVRWFKLNDLIPEVEIYACDPWDLPSKSCIPDNSKEWFYFCRSGTESHNQRATEVGYWKEKGCHPVVKEGGNETIGMKKTLEFYKRGPPHDEQTNWVIHEYSLGDEQWKKAASVSNYVDAVVVCKLVKTTGRDDLTEKSRKKSAIDEGIDNVEDHANEKDMPGPHLESPLPTSSASPSDRCI